ncbi:hypothetical protein PZB74_07780 [Porifericola rhodea]|uniref:hypothetical protein n=1 Tax=Porifericola rhodea TaxID=930972 RepID=UPI0026671357|nr:hypothetical protein [Porifericola rhodea]WKN33238.1 hypothetical protein PZB74_07780 [Porifericola rhodea]
MEEQEELRVEPWMRGVLLLAGTYNIGWGFFIFNFPESFYQWVSQSEMAVPSIISWQGIGVLFFGLLYLAIAIYPSKLVYLLLVGIASKLIGAAWFYWFVMEGEATKQFLFHLIMNDLVWIPPFAVVFIRILKVRLVKYQLKT